MNSPEQLAAARKLVEFVRNFTLMQETQLNAIRDSIQTLVENVMVNIKDINNKTVQKAEEADVVLITANTGSQLEQIAVEKPRVFERASGAALEQYEAKQQELTAITNTRGNKVTDLKDSRARRIGGRFTKHMEALTQLDSELSQLMFSMIGNLSGDDVIRQKLDHVIAGVENLSAALTRAVESGRLMSESEIDQLRARVLTDLYRSYTAESEKEIFHKVFGRPIGVRKVS